MIYILVFILLLIPVIRYDLMAKTGGEEKWYYFNLVVLILLAGLRYRVGGDTLMYMSMHDDMPAMDELKYFDFENALYNPFWYIYVSVFKSISDDFLLFQFAQAVIVNVVFFRFFKKYSPHYYFSAILLYYIGYYCYFNMEIMREIICVCILMLITPFLLEKRWILYYAGCVLAIQFHFSAAVMLIIPIFYIFLAKPSWKLQMVFIAGVMLLTKIVNIMTLLVGILSQNDQMVGLVEKYSDDSSNIAGMFVQLIACLPLVGLMYIRSNYKIDYHDRFVPMAMGVVFAYSFAMSFFAFSRLANYFIPFVLVFTVHTVYYFISSFKAKVVQVSYTVMTCSLMLMFFNYYYYYMRDMSVHYPNTRFNVIFSPYHSVFDPEIEEHRERFIENYRDVIFLF